MPEVIDTKNHPTVKALIEHQDRLKLTDSALARRMRISPASWSLLKSGTYNVKDPTRMLAICESTLRMIEEEEQKGDDAVLALSEQRAVISAVKLAANEERDRMIVFLGETGAGKTTLTRLIENKYGTACVVIEASETWRENYFSALLDFQRALGLPEAKTARAAQNDVLDDLAVSPRIIVIDEAHYCGRAAQNLIKLVLNDRRVRTRVVALAIPKLWQDMCRSAATEAAQLRNRTLAKVTMEEVKHDDCAALMASLIEDYTPAKADKAAVAALCSAANKFGLLNTVRRVCREINEIEGSVSLDSINAAIKRVQELRS